MNTQISINDITKYSIRRGFKNGNSTAIILTGLIEPGKEYITWKDEKTGDVIIREKSDNQ